MKLIGKQIVVELPYSSRPWVRTYYGIKARCDSSKTRYYKRGIKCFITVEQLLFLWKRDRAFKMKKPSIDRIDNNGNYDLRNCRYIEQAENARLGSIGRNTSRLQLKAAVNTISKVNSCGKNTHRKKVTNGERIFNSLREAAAYYGILETSISNSCKGTRKTGGGYKWRYVNDKDALASNPSAWLKRKNES